MSAGYSQLNGLAPEVRAYCPPQQAPVVCAPACHENKGYNVGGWGNFFLWFIIIAVVAFIIMWLLNPVGLQQRDAAGLPNGHQDAGRIVFAAIIVALVIVLILWLLRSVRY